MTTTDIYEDEAVGTVAATFGHYAKTTLEEFTQAMQLHIEVTSPNASPVLERVQDNFKLHYAVSPFDYASEAEAAGLIRQACDVSLDLAIAGTGLANTKSCVIHDLGGYLYTWISNPTLKAAVSVNVKLVELPLEVPVEA